MKCSGVDVANGEPAEISFDRVIGGVEPILGAGAPASGENTAWLAPAFIDLQVNGFAGADYNDPETPAEDIARSLEAQFSAGVARLFPTVITGSPERMTGALRNLARVRAALPRGAAMEGFHVEGPYISGEDGPRGAHPERWVRPPDYDEFLRFQDAAEGLIRIVTVAPEWPGAPRFIERLTGAGVAVSIGHTGADAARIADAVGAGATMSTHLGNGAHRTLPRHPNYLWEQLANDKLTASFIADGIHLGGAFLKSAVRAKGAERSVLVTDAVMPAGCAPGRYGLGEVEVELHADGSVRMPGTQRLAGSALRMDDAVSNAMAMCGLPLVAAVAMATRNPARAGRIASRQRGLMAGERADLVLFRLIGGRIKIVETWLSGERVYRSL